MQILKARTLLSLAAREGHIRRNVSINCSTVEKSKETKNLKSWEEVPGPPSLPFLGVILNFFPGGQLAGCKGGKLTDRLYELYGPIVKFDAHLGGQRKVFLFDPQAVENVLRREEPQPVRPTPVLEYYLKRHNKVYDPNRPTGLGTEMLREAIEIKNYPNFNREDGLSLSPAWDPVLHLIKEQARHKTGRP